MEYNELDQGELKWWWNRLAWCPYTIWSSYCRTCLTSSPCTIITLSYEKIKRVEHKICHNGMRTFVIMESSNHPKGKGYVVTWTWLSHMHILLFVCIACLCITSPLYCDIDHVTDGIMRFGVCLMVASWYSEHYMMTILAHREQNKLHGSCITVLIYIVYSSFKSNHNWSIRQQFLSLIAILVRLQVVMIIPVHLWTSGLCGWPDMWKEMHILQFLDLELLLWMWCQMAV